MHRVTVWNSFLVLFLSLVWVVSGEVNDGYAEGGDPSHTIVGTVQNQDLRRVDQATV